MGGKRCRSRYRRWEADEAIAPANTDGGLLPARLDHPGAGGDRRRGSGHRLRIRWRASNAGQPGGPRARWELVIYGALNIQAFDLGVPELLRLIFKNQSLTGFAVMPLLTAETLRASLRELFDLFFCNDTEIT